jgi:hypothetical protein
MSSDQHPPDDFPRTNLAGAVSGAAPKLLLCRTNDGRYSTEKISEEDRITRWMYCEDLARQFADAALKSKQGKRAHMSEVQILDQYLERLLNKGWASDSESRWVLRRAARILGWASPINS